MDVCDILLMQLQLASSKAGFTQTVLRELLNTQLTFYVCVHLKHRLSKSLK